MPISSITRLNQLWKLMLTDFEEKKHFDYKDAMQLAQEFRDEGRVAKAKEIRKWAARVAQRK